ncbi:MAG: hypothetical protein CVU54_18605 [Deltaproteobacteria bacterium HGW-Deltaproteobacteria-12]|jgi:lipid II:glycine glycyltransferase (peptidoglycan interpeptide bridge formation enzyme)|nr:MAG: hypothetical protein CVU54_18605 [Deltaproteobacteria bacterium HGW-Deltaproteobacteria-12]
MRDSSGSYLSKHRLPFIPDSNADFAGSENIRLLFSYSEKDDEWDDFLYGLESAHHEQTSMWGRVKMSCGGYQPVRFLAYLDEQLVGGCQILHKKIRRTFHVGYICFGPCWAPMDDKLAFWLNRQFVRFIRELGIQYVYVDFPYDGFKTAEYFHTLGFRRHPDFLPPWGRMKASVVLNLDLSEQELLSQMKASTRSNIKYGVRAGIVVKRNIQNAPELFTDLMWKLCRRRGCAPTPPESDFFTRIQEAFAESGQVHFFFAFLGEEAVSSLVAFTAGNWVRSWKVGWSGDYSRKHPNEVLEWEVIKWAKQAGYSKFDFVGIDRKCAEELISGHVMPDSPDKSVALFKLGFGGKPMLIPLPASIVFNPLLRAMLYSEKIQDLPFVKRIVTSIERRH